jgi:ethanolamine utilization protein EutN
VRIAEVIGSITLSRSADCLRGKRMVIGVPYSLSALTKQGRGDGEDLVILDPLGSGLGSVIAFSEGGEAAAPFFPEKCPIDAYAACILDQIQIKNV